MCVCVWLCLRHMSVNLWGIILNMEAFGAARCQNLIFVNIFILSGGSLCHLFNSFIDSIVTGAGHVSAGRQIASCQANRPAGHPARQAIIQTLRLHMPTCDPLTAISYYTLRWAHSSNEMKDKTTHDAACPVPVPVPALFPVPSPVSCSVPSPMPCSMPYPFSVPRPSPLACTP